MRRAAARRIASRSPADVPGAFRAPYSVSVSGALYPTTTFGTDQTTIAERRPGRGHR